MGSSVVMAGVSRRPLEIGYISLFLCLQVLDVVTTLIGFRMGLAEASPFVRWLTHFGPVLGLVVSKFVALSLLSICVFLQRTRVIRLATCWYIALVVWNIFVLASYRGV